MGKLGESGGSILDGILPIDNSRPKGLKPTTEMTFGDLTES